MLHFGVPNAEITLSFPTCINTSCGSVKNIRGEPFTPQSNPRNLRHKSCRLVCFRQENVPPPIQHMLRLAPDY